MHHRLPAQVANCFSKSFFFFLLFACESRVPKSFNSFDNVNARRVKIQMKWHRENQIKEDGTVIKSTSALHRVTWLFRPQALKLFSVQTYRSTLKYQVGFSALHSMDCYLDRGEINL